jgi:hypothetical protein
MSGEHDKDDDDNTGRQQRRWPTMATPGNDDDSDAALRQRFRATPPCDAEV